MFLTEITLVNNQIEEIEANGFNGLASLINLDLSLQSLNFISNGSFNGLASLNNLSLNECNFL